MKTGGFLFCLLTGLLGVVACEVKKMPKGDLLHLELTRSGTMAGYEYKGRVRQDSMGDFVLKAMKESYGPLYEKKVDEEAMKHFRQIIEKEKMYKYKESYRPIMEVLDGWGWSFRAKFSDGTTIYSHGSNARPRGNGLVKIRGYMEELIQDGVQIESPEEEDE